VWYPVLDPRRGDRVVFRVLWNWITLKILGPQKVCTFQGPKDPTSTSREDVLFRTKDLKINVVARTFWDHFQRKFLGPQKVGPLILGLFPQGINKVYEFGVDIRTLRAQINHEKPSVGPWGADVIYRNWILAGQKLYLLDIWIYSKSFYLHVVNRQTFK
jgi:hypothetical protein